MTQEEKLKVLAEQIKNLEIVAKAIHDTFDTEHELCDAYSYLITVIDELKAKLVH